MSYTCRDCGFHVDKKAINSCPKCNSIYLIPDGFQLSKNNKKCLDITLSERFLSLLFGFFGGLLTFFIWGVTILVQGGPGAAKASVGVFYFGVKLALFMAIAFAIFGFLLGSERLVKLLSTFWGTNEEFNNSIERIVFSIPLWIGYIILSITIVGSYGYLAAIL